MTLQWYFEDLMISHKNMSDINVFLKNTESTGKKHNYLGMIFNFLFKDEVRINMTDYMLKIIKEFPEKIMRQ